MATIFYKTGGDFSTAVPKKVVASALAPSIAFLGYEALNTMRYIAFTASEGGTCEGVFVCLGMASVSAAQSVTAKLQQNTGSWVDVAGATKTLTYQEIAGTYNTQAGMMCWVYFEFGTPAVITTDASTWRIAISSTDANARIRSTYGYGIVITGTTSYSPSDNILFNGGCEFVIDQSITATTYVTGVNTQLVWEAEPISSYTFAGTTIYMSKDTKIQVGTELVPIPYAKQAIFNVTNMYAPQGHEGVYGFRFEFWGEYPDDIVTSLASNANSGQAVIVTTKDMSAIWSVGDVLFINGRNSIGNSAYHCGVISSMTGTSITLTGNLTANHMSGWGVINVTRGRKMGVRFASGFNLYCPTHFIMSGVTVDASKKITGWGWNVAQDSVNNVPTRIENCIFGDKTIVEISGNIEAGSNFENLYFNATGYVGFLLTLSAYAAITLKNLYFSITNATFGFTITIYNSSIDNLECSGGYYPFSTNYSSLTATGCTVNNLKAISGYYALRALLISTTLTNCVLGMAVYSLMAATNIDSKFIDSDIGNTFADSTGLINCGTNYYIVLQFENCDIGSTVVNNLSNAIKGSNIRLQDYNSTNNHLSIWDYGKMQSTGDGLADTTVHTSGTGKFAIRFEPKSSTDNLEWDFTIPTGDIQNKTMTVGVWCKINSATYYAGTHQLPRLTIDYDNGTTAYCQAGESTDWQLLFVTFTPATTYGQITVTLSGRTDATTTDAYIYFDDFTVAYPPSVALDLGGLDNWADALPVTPPIALPISAGTVATNVWQQLKSTDYGTGTMGTYVKNQLELNDVILGK